MSKKIISFIIDFLFIVVIIFIVIKIIDAKHLNFFKDYYHEEKYGLKIKMVLDTEDIYISEDTNPKIFVEKAYYKKDNSKTIKKNKMKKISKNMETGIIKNYIVSSFVNICEEERVKEEFELFWIEGNYYVIRQAQKDQIIIIFNKNTNEMLVIEKKYD